MTPTQLARYFQVTPKTIRRWVMSGKIPARRIGSRIRFMPREVLRKMERVSPVGRELSTAAKNPKGGRNRSGNKKRPKND
jgi:excisionase family DNA binding protein